MKTVPAGEFKAKCLRLMEEVSQTGEPLLVTKRGKPVVQVRPASVSDLREEVLNDLHGTVTYHGDIVGSTYEDAGWEETESDENWQ